MVGALSNKLDTLSGDDKIIAEATARFNRVSEWESTARERYVADLKFARADSDNGYQWPNNLLRARAGDSKPCLTMNMIRQHNLQIVNEAKRNKSSIKVIGRGNGATQESANVMRQIIGHIEYQSNAQAAYETAREFQVDAGYGVVRLVTDWAGPDSFDQELFIRRIPDPLSVFFDPDALEKDKSDGSFAFVFDTLTEEEWNQHFSKYNELLGMTPLGVVTADSDWTIKDHVRVVEYFRKVPKKDKLVSFVHQGTRHTVRLSKLHKDMHQMVLENPATKMREVEDTEVQWFLIAGNKIIDRTTWVGKYIPLACCVGEEVVIEGQMDRKGHTRYLKDSQRMFNYHASAGVEFGALQGKTPWIAPAQAIEEFTTMWNSANRVNHSVLVYRHIDDDGSPIPPPQKAPVPQVSPVYEQGQINARNWMMETSGQYGNQMGEGGNERTGRAIDRRLEQSATSVYHFQNNYAEMLRYLGKQLIDVIPKVYDTRRVKMIMADDGTEMEVEIDPTARQAYLQYENHVGEVIRRIFNPRLGQYDVGADVGPAYGSRRQETADALTLILTQAPALTGILGDLLMGSLDFDKAQEAEQRMKRMVPPQALGKGPTQAEQQLQTQVQTLHGLLAKAVQENAKQDLKLVGKTEGKAIDAYKALTGRLEALAKLEKDDPAALQGSVEALVQEIMEGKLTPVLEANRKALADLTGDTPEEAPPMQGAKKAPDGQWYLADPTREGKYLRVGPLAQQKSGSAGVR